MDFFARQDQARHRTTLLVAYLALGIVLMTLAIYASVAGLFLHHRYQPDSLRWLWDPSLFATVIVATLAIVGIGSLTKIQQLSAGGNAVAQMLGGRRIHPGTANPAEQRLLHVVEEMAIASGVPMPELYVMDREAGINAFVAGKSSADAALTVTQGALKWLSRDELQGVVAHEFSHLLNGDMRLNVRLIGWVYGILCMTVVGRILLRIRGRKNPLPAVGLVMVVIGSIGVLVGRLIQSAVCRQREFLADAAAVQFTRNPGGLAGALKKIGGLACGSRLRTAHAQEASHLLFENGLRQGWFGWFASHPPLQQRIHLLDPAFDGKFHVLSVPEGMELPSVGPTAPPLFALADQPQAVDQALAPPRFSVPARRVLPGLGAPGPKQLAYAASFNASLPAELKAMVSDPGGACALVYGMLLSGDEEARAGQLKELHSQLDVVSAAQMTRCLPLLSGLATTNRLPLLMLAIPALRRLSPAQFVDFARISRWIIESDREVSLFEYAMQKTVERQLEPYFAPPKKRVVQYYSWRPLLGDVTVLLSAVAHMGAPDSGQARAAFGRGVCELPWSGAELEFLESGNCGLAEIDRALDRLSQAVPQVKKMVLLACVAAVAQDELVQENEAELLRAIADSLDCPIPPFMQGI